MRYHGSDLQVDMELGDGLEASSATVGSSVRSMDVSIVVGPEMYVLCYIYIYIHRLAHRIFRNK